MLGVEILSALCRLYPNDFQIDKALSLIGSNGELPARVMTGVDVLAAQKFAPLSGKRVGVITNHTGLSSDGRRTIDLLAKAPGVKLVAILTPEHGLTGLSEGKIAAGRDAVSRVPVYSLYGETLRPTPAMLKGLDALVFDVQDAGARFYTYMSTMGYAMEAASRAGISFFVLDRPNPISAARVEGPVLDANLKSFTGYFPLPVRHGMTLGELAQMFNAENRIGVKLAVIAMRGYRRDMWFDETGLTWINPSPNLRSLTQAALYPAVALAEASNVSVGRGTNTPFEMLGAPWIQAQALCGRSEWTEHCRRRFSARHVYSRCQSFQGAALLRCPDCPDRPPRAGFRIAGSGNPERPLPSLPQRFSNRQGAFPDRLARGPASDQGRSRSAIHRGRLAAAP